MITEHTDHREAYARFRAATGPALLRQYAGRYLVFDAPDECINHPSTPLKVPEGQRTGRSFG